MNLDSLHQDIILDHSRNPHHAGLREPFDAEVHDVNPRGEDEVTLRVTLGEADGEPVLVDVSYEALGCSIHRASVSIMTELIVGKTVREATAISDAFRDLMLSRGTGEPDDDVLDEAVVFAHVSRYPERVKCALLGWMAWQKATNLALDLRNDPAPAPSLVAAALGFVSGPTAMLFNEQIILDHYRKPLHGGLRVPFDAQVYHANRDGRDEVTLRVMLSDAVSEPVLADVSYQAFGCAINKASISVMADLVIGKTVREAMSIRAAFLNQMDAGGATKPHSDVIKEAGAFASIARYPARVKCVVLGWTALRDAATLALSHLD